VSFLFLPPFSNTFLSGKGNLWWARRKAHPTPQGVCLYRRQRVSNSSISFEEYLSAWLCWQRLLEVLPDDSRYSASWGHAQSCVLIFLGWALGRNMVKEGTSHAESWTGQLYPKSCRTHQCADSFMGWLSLNLQRPCKFQCGLHNMVVLANSGTFTSLYCSTAQGIKSCDSEHLREQDRMLPCHSEFCPFGMYQVTFT
jgi:hypothetical protein